MSCRVDSVVTFADAFAHKLLLTLSSCNFVGCVGVLSRHPIDETHMNFGFRTCTVIHSPAQSSRETRCQLLSATSCGVRSVTQLGVRPNRRSSSCPRMFLLRGSLREEPSQGLVPDVWSSFV